MSRIYQLRPDDLRDLQHGQLLELVDNMNQLLARSGA